MYEARLIEGALLKKIIDAVRELVTDANLDCSESGISMQAMDSSHVSLCALMIRSDGFDHYRCDRSLSLGLSMANIAKILKCAGNKDTVTLKTEDSADTLTIMFESEGKPLLSQRVCSRCSAPELSLCTWLTCPLLSFLLPVLGGLVPDESTFFRYSSSNVERAAVPQGFCPGFRATRLLFRGLDWAALAA